MRQPWSSCRAEATPGSAHSAFSAEAAAVAVRRPRAGARSHPSPSWAAAPQPRLPRRCPLTPAPRRQFGRRGRPCGRATRHPRRHPRRQRRPCRRRQRQIRARRPRIRAIPRARDGRWLLPSSSRRPRRRPASPQGCRAPSEAAAEVAAACSEGSAWAGRRRRLLRRLPHQWPTVEAMATQPPRQPGRRRPRRLRSRSPPRLRSCRRRRRRAPSSRRAESRSRQNGQLFRNP
mmetsp:Transcript_2084/g.8119  ORF Transcript_2084/g.8119 Transcript_2084/m.8119 type:complete len:232 (-) Transcript_2084:1760-2455(-)